MSVWMYLLLVAGGLLVIFCACLAPERFFRLVFRLGVNSALGLALLVLINAAAGFSGFQLPLNGLTLAVSGLLGAPGVVAIAALAAI